MCGITGWVAYDLDLTTRRSVIEDMTSTMADAGPMPPAPGSAATRRSATAGSR